MPPRFKRYAALSKVVMGIFRSITPLVEPLSLDEAFLDVSAIAGDAADAERIAANLKKQVHLATGLTLSVGGGANKTVAKIASDLRKPDGLLIVPHGEERQFLAPLPVRALWGIGPKTERDLNTAAIRTIGDLADRSPGDAQRLLGSRGEFVLAMARGVDERPIETVWERKSVGAERTFARDLPDGPEFRAELRRTAEDVAARMARLGVRAHTVAIKLRYAQFKTITRQASTSQGVESARQIEEIAAGLLDETAAPGDQFRLLGIQCSRLEGTGTARQRKLWDLFDDGEDR